MKSVVKSKSQFFQFVHNYFTLIHTIKNYSLVHLLLVLLLRRNEFIEARLNPMSEHQLFSDALCPSPLKVENSTDGGTPTYINVHNNTVLIKLAEDDPVYNRFLPCSFEVDVPNANNDPFVNITAVMLNSEAWNFSNSRPCQEYFQFEHREEYGDGFKVECKGWKRAPFSDSISLYAHRLILDYRWKPKRLSFSFFHSSVGHDFHDEHENLTDLRYMQIHFSAAVGERGTICTVQQYELDIDKLGCTDGYDIHSICGEYDCRNAHIIDQKYRKLVIMDEPIFLDGDKDDYSNHRILSLGTLLAAAMAPVVCSLFIFLVYRFYFSPHRDIRYTRSSNRGESQPGNHRGSLSAAVNSLELVENRQPLRGPIIGSSAHVEIELDAIPTLSSAISDDSPLVVTKPLLTKSERKASASSEIPFPYDDESPMFGKGTTSSGPAKK